MPAPTFVPFSPVPAERTDHILEITPEAREQLERLLAAEGGTTPRTLRIAVVGGGCSGLSYSMELTAPRPGDRVEDRGWLRVAVDPSAVSYLAGTTLHFDGGLNGRGFVFHNPNARRTCSCGDSFAV